VLDLLMRLEIYRQGRYSSKMYSVNTPYVYRCSYSNLCRQLDQIK